MADINVSVNVGKPEEKWFTPSPFQVPLQVLSEHDPLISGMVGYSERLERIADELEHQAKRLRREAKDMLPTPVARPE